MRLGYLTALSAAALLALTPSAHAKTYKPDKTGDSPSGGLSLREAISKANAHPGTDTVKLEGGKTYKLSIGNAGGVDEDANATGDLDILGSLKILSSSKEKAAKVNAKGIDRVFEVGSTAPPTGVSATFKFLKIMGGKTAPLPADGIGGGITVNGGSSASVSWSTISGNQAEPEANGGGIEVLAQAYLTVRNSTISGNVGDDGGGIRNIGSAQVSNSTVSGNFATDDGGGLSSQTSPGDGFGLTMNAVTVARNVSSAFDPTNTSGKGGGISEEDGKIFVKNSLIALNTIGPGTGSGLDCHNDDPGGIVSLGHNLIGTTANCTFTAGSGDIFNPPIAQIKIGLLKKNGGPTKTIALGKGSIAINHAGSDSPKRDQRGEKRKKPDIGAFERI
jgi:hypothetical protein